MYPEWATPNRQDINPLKLNYIYKKYCRWEDKATRRIHDRFEPELLMVLRSSLSLRPCATPACVWLALCKTRYNTSLELVLCFTETWIRQVEGMNFKMKHKTTMKNCLISTSWKAENKDNILKDYTVSKMSYLCEGGSSPFLSWKKTTR